MTQQPIADQGNTSLIESLINDLGDGDALLIPPDPQPVPDGAPAQAETPPAEPEPSIPAEQSALQAQLEEAQAKVAEFERQTNEAKIAQAQAAEREQLAMIEQAGQQYATQLEQQQGVNPTLARQIANEKVELARRAYQAESRAQAKVNAANYYAKEYGVDAGSLMQHETPDAMKMAAQHASEMASLRAEVEALKKSAVEPQEFDSGQGASTMSANAKMTAFANGINNDLDGMQKLLESQGVNFGF